MSQQEKKILHLCYSLILIVLINLCFFVPASQQWMVPLQFSSNQSPQESVKTIVLDSKQEVISLSGLSESDWVKLNPGTVGFYRTQYPAAMLASFVPAIIDKTLPPLDRFGILDDLSALVRSTQSLLQCCPISRHQYF